jgi:hypothetical protein
MSQKMGKLLQFKNIKVNHSHEALGSASKFQIYFSRIIECFGKLFCNFHIPGFIKPIELHDEVTGYQVNIKVSPHFTKLSINGRDFYFHRLTGKYDGTGQGCS